MHDHNTTRADRGGIAAVTAIRDRCPGSRRATPHTTTPIAGNGATKADSWSTAAGTTVLDGGAAIGRWVQLDTAKMNPAEDRGLVTRSMPDGRVEVLANGAVAVIRMNRPDKRNALDAEQIAALGSISAGGRAMDMSYRRAWELIEELNSIFGKPVVESRSGGRKGGGATLTPLGLSLISRYRAMERAAAAATAPHLAALSEEIASAAGEQT